MARAIWTGTVSFGLVAVPVKLYRATENRDVRFRELQRGTGERVRHKRVAESSGKELSQDDIVKGYEVQRGEYVVVEPEELEAVDPGPARTVEIEEFVDLAAIDPIQFQTTYYLAPANEGAVRPYRLLRQVMEDTGRAAIGRVVLRGKQHLATVRPLGRALAMETMFFADEVRDAEALEEMDQLDEGQEPSDRELKAATQLVESLSADWDPERYRDTYREQVLELVHRKAEGHEVVAEQAEEPAPVIDLMAALEESLEGARGGKRSGRRQRRGRDRRREQSSRQGRGRTSTWDTMSKDELYDEAQRRDIAGRSKMTRQDLIAALREAS